MTFLNVSLGVACTGELLFSGFHINFLMAKHAVTTKLHVVNITGAKL